MLYREHKPVLVPIDESPEDKLVVVEEAGNKKDTGEGSTKQEDESYHGRAMEADVNENEADRHDEVDEADEVDEVDEGNNNDKENDEDDDADLDEDDDDDDEE
jgi:hypothetical protein